MNRRDTVLALLALGVAPVAALAQQQGKIPRIGVLIPGSRTGFSLRTEALLQGLRDLGYVEGKTIAIEWRWADGRVEELPRLAAELVGAGVDVIVTGGTPAAKALKNATRTIPIVVALFGDPVGAGLVESLARPGGNVTGFSDFAPILTGKRLEILGQVAPGTSRVAALLNSQNPNTRLELDSARAAASKLTVQLLAFEASDPNTLETAFAAMKKNRIRVHMVLTDPALYSQRDFIVDLAARNQMLGMYPLPEYVQAGGLISYGSDSKEFFRRAATYVDKILKGAKPGDLPIEQPTQFELVINLKTAKALGITIPQSLLLRADRVIE
jgi:putative tryptophan/tyrosine transport system substrate-binding protein